MLRLQLMEAPLKAKCLQSSLRGKLPKGALNPKASGGWNGSQVKISSVKVCYQNFVVFSFLSFVSSFLCGAEVRTSPINEKGHIWPLTGKSQEAGGPQNILLFRWNDSKYSICDLGRANLINQWPGRGESYFWVAATQQAVGNELMN